MNLPLVGFTTELHLQFFFSFCINEDQAGNIYSREISARLSAFALLPKKEREMTLGKAMFGDRDKFRVKLGVLEKR